jgi:hypothetical protein
MPDWGRRVVAGSLLGAALGVLLGLVLARVLWPATGPVAGGVTPVESSTPPASITAPPPTPTQPPPAEAVVAQSGEEVSQALVLVAALHALDGDLERATERLGTLGLDPQEAAEAVAELALRQAAEGNARLATDLATLAAALGQGAPELLAYVATPTDTATPAPRPSATPSATLTSLPSAAPSPVPATRVPPTATQRPAATAPPAGSGSTAPTALPWDWWDRRVDLLEPPVRLVEAQVAPGERYWRLVRLEWWKPGEGGNGLLYVTTLNEKGIPAWGQEVIVEHGAQERLYTSPKPGELYGLNYPMYSTLNSYLVFVGGSLPSDRVTGLGLGEWLGGTDHTTYVLVFQLTVK